MGKYLKILIFILLTDFSFSQCNEYYINEIISGPTERIFLSGSPMKFCPKISEVSLNGYVLNSTWAGRVNDLNQIITLYKNGGVAGSLVLNLEEKKLKISLFGSPGDQVYSISLNREEYNNFLIK